MHNRNVVHEVDSTRDRKEGVCEKSLSDANADENGAHGFQQEPRVLLRGSGAGRLAENAKVAAGGWMKAEDGEGATVSHVGDAGSRRRHERVAEAGAKVLHLSQGEGRSADVQDQVFLRECLCCSRLCRHHCLNP